MSGMEQFFLIMTIAVFAGFAAALAYFSIISADRAEAAPAKAPQPAPALAHQH